MRSWQHLLEGAYLDVLENTPGQVGVSVRPGLGIGQGVKFGNDQAAQVAGFAWVFGIDEGWNELTTGADLEVPVIFRTIIKYVTPALLLVILGSWLFQILPPVLRYEGVNPDFVPYVRAARLTMVGIFLAFCLAVSYAWRNHSAAQAD